MLHTHAPYESATVAIPTRGQTSHPCRARESAFAGDSWIVRLGFYIALLRAQSSKRALASGLAPPSHGIAQQRDRLCARSHAIDFSGYIGVTEVPGRRLPNDLLISPLRRSENLEDAHYSSFKTLTKVACDGRFYWMLVRPAVIDANAPPMPRLSVPLFENSQEWGGD